MYLYKKIASEITEKIVSGEYENGHKLKTEVEIAKEYGVSVITAKKTLDDLASNGLVIRQRGRGTFVINNRIQFNDETAKKFLVGIIFDNPNDMFGNIFLQSIEKELMDKGVQFMVRNSLDSDIYETKILHEFIELGVDCIVITPVNGEKYNPYLLSLILDGFPIITIDRKLNLVDTYYVGTEHFEAAKEMGTYLFTTGIKKICFVYHKVNHDSIQERINGLFDAYKANEIPLTNMSTLELRPFWREEDNNLNIEIETLEKFIIDNPDVECFFCSDTGIANEVYSIALKHNINIPNDLTIVCFDEMYFLNDNFKFTHIQQDQEKIASEVIQLIEEINSKHIINNKERYVSGKLKIGHTSKE